MKIENVKEYYKRNLPHIQPVGACFFVTFRLKDSIPAIKLTELKESYELRYGEIMRSNSQHKNYDLYRERKLYFAKYDKILDSIKYGPTYLNQPKIAEIVKKELHRFDGSLYKLICYSIMPNHVHILIDTVTQFPEKLDIKKYFSIDFQPLNIIMRKIKGPSSRYSNLELNRSGQFWQRESFDHYVRDNRELLDIINYILNNPVKANIVTKWEDHTFSFYADSELS